MIVSGESWKATHISCFFLGCTFWQKLDHHLKNSWQEQCWVVLNLKVIYYVSALESLEYSCVSKKENPFAVPWAYAACIMQVMHDAAIQQPVATRAPDGNASCIFMQFNSNA